MRTVQYDAACVTRRVGRECALWQVLEDVCMWFLVTFCPLPVDCLH